MSWIREAVEVAGVLAPFNSVREGHEAVHIIRAKPHPD